MFKRIRRLLLCGLAILCISGCGHNNDVNKNDNDKNDFDSLIKQTGLNFYDIKCDEIKDIVDINNGDKFITSTGKLYELDGYKLFSTNDKNCRVMDVNFEPKRFLAFRYIVDKENNIYDYYSYKKITQIDKGGELFVTIDHRNYSIKDYYYYKDNKIYEVLKDENNNFTLTDKVVFSLKDDEEIEYLIDDVIKTNIRIYVYKSLITNEEQCNKYNDVECIYESKFVEVDDVIQKLFDKILFYKTGKIVDKDGKLYANCLGCGG